MQKEKVAAKRKNNWHWILATICFSISVLIFGRSFFPIVREEIKYNLNSKKDIKSFDSNPIDQKFSILIPKLWINSRVIPKVDPNNSHIYQKALSLGVAQSLGSALPGENGNIFLFAHSATNWYEARDYNAVFYLIYKLETGDTISLVYLGKKYDYKVIGKKIIESTNTKYMEKGIGENKLTLMTCWPPGTEMKRLIVEASLEK